MAISSWELAINNWQGVRGGAIEVGAHSLGRLRRCWLLAGWGLQVKGRACGWGAPAVDALVVGGSDCFRERLGA